MGTGRTKVAIAFAVLALLALFGFLLAPWAIDRIAIGWLNEHFPPRSAAEAQASAIKSSASSLNEIAISNVAFTLSTDTLASLLSGAIGALDTQAIKIDQLSVHSGGQQVRFSGEFTAPIGSLDGAASGQAQGSISVSTTDRGIVLTPALDRVQVASLSLKGHHLPGMIVSSVGDALTSVMANVNSRIKPIELAFIKQLTSEQRVSLGSQTIIVPAQSLTAASILIDDKGITFLGQINGERQQNQQPVGSTDFPGFKSAFLAKGAPLLTGAPKDGLVLSPDLVKSAFSGFGASIPPQQRATASLEAAWRSVHNLKGPDVSLILPAANIGTAIAPLLQKALGEAAAKKSITLLDSKFVLSDGRLSVVATATADLKDPVPGKATFRLGIGGSPVSENGSLSLLPVLVEVEIIKIETTRFDPTELVISVNSILAGLVSGVSQALPSIPIDVPPLRIASIDLKEIAKKTPGLELSPATLPAAEGKLAGAAILMAGDGIQILADVDLASPNLADRPAGVAPPPFSGKIEDLKEAFSQRRRTRFPDADMASISADVSWTRLAEITNAHWQDIGGIQAVYRVDTGSQAMTPTEIRLVKKPTYACSQRNCSFHSCANDCTRDGCDWACGRGICTDVPCPSLMYPGKFCQKCTGEPVCEANKAACQVAREPKYQACRTACDVAANTEKAACDAAAVTDKAGCDLGNAIQQLASQIGGIGKIGGDGRAQGVIKADAAALTLTTDRPGIRFAPKIAVDLTVSGAIDFTPYDIGTVLVCPAKGKAFFSANVTLPPQQPSITASFAAAPPDPAAPSTLILNGHVDSFNLRAKITPAPAEAVLTQNPQLLVECNPVLTGAITGLSIIGKAQGLSGGDIIRALAGKQASAAFTGDVDYDLDGFDIPIKIEHKDLKLGEQVLVVVAHLGEHSIGFSVRQ
ncbi:hypothetical protein [Bradyrhizobium sp. CCGB01]|uniref:hypothetical protein n=1 Tax=Bradyrhizobium sp. CCGB01 TaxID=2949634 RepID=UPI0020B4176D|nr:hypothetical protein [Bradyrhizobium sp. CCGB01]MCP3406140.1 hypothetical protein [Bradyrhizobium sp. CCGB01]